jgi:protein SCO1/2
MKSSFAHCISGRAIVAVIVLCASVLHTAPLAADSQADLFKQVGIDQHIDAQVPTDLVFHDEAGRDVRLAEYFGRRPIVLSLVYYGCPMLCTTVLNELTVSLNVMPTSVGEQFDILTISFDPAETPALAAKKKAEYLRSYRRPHGQDGWHFLTGDAASIAALTRAVGFRYAKDPTAPGQFIHAGGLMVLTPSGKISRYFFGINYAPKDLRLALAEASQEKSGSLTNAILLFCFHYDPHTGRFTLAILNFLKAGATLTLLGVGIYVVRSIRRERKMLGLSRGSEGIASL